MVVFLEKTLKLRVPIAVDWSEIVNLFTNKIKRNTAKSACCSVGIIGAIRRVSTREEKAKTLPR